MPAESETFESKSDYSGSPRERLRIVKTILSMANAHGGTIQIRRVTGGMRNLDSASLTTTVNKYIDPPLNGLAAEVDDDGVVTILVPRSDRKPHITKANGNYRQGEETKTSFYKGQIWIRHSSSNDLVNPDDLRSIVFEAAGNLLEVLGAKLKTPGFTLDPSNPAAVPASLVNSPGALLIHTDFASAYPHTRQSLQVEFGKSYGWISIAMPKLGLEKSTRHAYTDRNSAGHPTRWRYTDIARDELAEKLANDPDWDPSAPDRVEVDTGT